jgi:hypothetical protein
MSDEQSQEEAWRRLEAAKQIFDEARDALTLAAYELCDVLDMQRWSAPFVMVELDHRIKKRQAAEKARESEE